MFCIFESGNFKVVFFYIILIYNRIWKFEVSTNNEIVVNFIIYNKMLTN